jgi:hypothetical protein
MLEQILKSDGSKMVRMSNNLVIQLIEEKFKDTPFEIVHRVKDNGDYILQNPMMIAVVEKSRTVKVSFHVAVRSDITYQTIMKFKEIKEIKSLNISAVFYYDVRDFKVYYGNEAEEKLLIDLKTAIISNFMHEQTQLMMLKNMRSPYVC